MAEVVFWQSTGYWNSVAPALYDAAQLKGLGVDVAIFFQGEAIAALAEGKFDWSPPLAKYATTLEGNLKKMGLPTELADYLKICKDAGVALYGSGGWSDLLGVRGKLPPEIQILEIPEAEKLMAEAKNIIGGP